MKIAFLLFVYTAHELDWIVVSFIASCLPYKVTCNKVRIWFLESELVHKAKQQWNRTRSFMHFCYMYLNNKTKIISVFVIIWTIKSMHALVTDMLFWTIGFTCNNNLSFEFKQASLHLPGSDTGETSLFYKC